MKTKMSRLPMARGSSPSGTADEIGGPLDPSAPRAFWRMIQIGEMAGIVTPADQESICAAFRDRETRREFMDRTLAPWKCSVVQLYILVTLFAAEPRAVSVPCLIRETLANSGALRFALQQLEASGAVSREVSAEEEPPVLLTAAGRELSVFLVYRALRAAVSPPQFAAHQVGPIGTKS